MSFLDKLFQRTKDEQRVITIDGEYGSGANALGAAIAQKLNIPFYDEKTIELMSLASKGKPEDVSKEDSFLQGTIYDLYRENYSYSQEGMTVNDAAFLMDARTIRDIAKEGSAVIVGKCADYILGKEEVFSLFVYADEAFKAKRVEESYHVKPEKVEAVMIKENARRSNHYSRKTGGTWGSPNQYDLCINSSHFSFSTIENMVVELYHAKK